MTRSERPTVVIVGRPNVGKSTVFNRITGTRRAIVGDEPGITRDRIHLPAEWQGKTFEVIDTGGILVGEAAEIPAQIVKQARVAIEQAWHIVFVIDGRTEITGADRELALLLVRTGKPVTLAVNKIDAAVRETLVADFYDLGIPEVMPISAEHGRGVPELLDHVTAGFPAGEAEDAAGRPIQIAIIGKPNVGKSTLLNRLVGMERAIVSETPGTTRDAVDATVTRHGAAFTFVDTAGIRRKGKTRLLAEKLSVVMARRHIRLADVVLVVIDGLEGVTALDASIAGYAHEGGKAVVLVVNKWDAAPRMRRDEFADELRDRLKFLDYAPVEFCSALTGARTERLFPLIQRVHAAARRRVPTGELNRFFAGLDLERAKVPAGQRLKIFYLTQAGVAPPTFVLFTDRPQKLHFAFERFLENRFRRAFDFAGTPIVIRTKGRRSRT